MAKKKISRKKKAKAKKKATKTKKKASKKAKTSSKGPRLSKDYEEWIRYDLRPQYPDLEPTFRKAVAGYDQIVASGSPNPEDLAALLVAARSSRRPLFFSGTELLGKLTGKHEEAREAVLAMAGDKSAQVRFNAVISLHATSPKEFATSVLRGALQDMSAKVRQKAADWALRIRARDVVPHLEALLATENNESVGGTAQLSLCLLRDGYQIEEDPDDDEVTLTVIGTTEKCHMTSGFFSREEIAKRGLNTLIRELQQGD